LVIRYLLGTNICIALIKDRPEFLRSRLTGFSTDEVGVSAIVVAELWYGVSLSQKKRQNESALRDFLDYVSVLDWPAEAGPTYGRLRAMLQKAGTPIGAMDLLIASHALWLDATLVTNNVKEFRRVPNLRIEDWLASGPNT
jgi:tRNA(fMet)-specific endonuclease VapC